MRHIQNKMHAIRALLISTTAVPQSDTHQFTAPIPIINLPKFSGEFSQWKSFKEVFTARIIDHTRMLPVEKLYHLRAQLHGTPKQMIADFPAQGDQFKLAWDMLLKEHDNLRNVVQHQLEILLQPPSPPLKSAASLKRFAASLTESTKSLISLRSNEKLWKWMVVYQSIQHLDKPTRDTGETSSGKSPTYPNFESLREFPNQDEHRRGRV